MRQTQKLLSVTWVSNWSPNMSTWPLLVRAGLCVSNHCWKLKGDITVAIFIWNGGSLNTSPVHSNIIKEALKVNSLHKKLIRATNSQQVHSCLAIGHYCDFKENLPGSGFPVLNCFEFMNLQEEHIHTQAGQSSWFIDLIIHKQWLLYL